MSESRTVFVVLDPTCMEQAALEWGEEVVRIFSATQNIAASLHVYCCVNPESVAVSPDADGETAEANTVARIEAWVERLVAQTRASGMTVTTEVEWRDDWRHAIPDAAKRNQSAVVIKNMTQHSRFVRLVRETSDWTLIRECECPMLLVKTGRPVSTQNLLVAVKHNPDDEAYRKANDDILAAAKQMASDLGGRLHAVTCYDHGSQPDRQRFADSCGLDRSQVSAGAGVPEKLIAEVAEERDTNLVIIARVAKPDNPGAVGKTARKLIDELNTEVLVLPVAS